MKHVMRKAVVSELAQLRVNMDKANLKDTFNIVLASILEGKATFDFKMELYNHFNQPQTLVRALGYLGYKCEYNEYYKVFSVTNL